MALPDYEAEYNNRARVPEHPAIIEGWARDAAAYRSGAGSRRRSVRYGEGERQVVDLFEPVVQKPGATCDVHPWRLLAGARPLVFQPSRKGRSMNTD